MKSRFQIRKQAYRIELEVPILRDSRMPLSFPEHNFIFTLAELQRVVRSYAEQKVARFGVTRARDGELTGTAHAHGVEGRGHREDS